MIKGLWFRLGVVLFVALLAVVPVVLTTQAGNVSLNGAHWARTKNPFSLRVGDNVSGRWDRYLDVAARDWRKSNVVTMRVVPGSTSPKACQARNGQIQVCSFDYRRTGWLGLATIWIDSKNHIVRASVQMNDYYFDSGYYNKPKAMQHTMCHELGHILGLDHNNQKSCLNDSDRSVFRDTRPSAQDRKELQRLYRHRDSQSSLRTATATDGGTFDADSVPELPTADTVSTNESVRSESTGDGGRVVTIITWIDESKVK